MKIVGRIALICWIANEFLFSSAWAVQKSSVIRSQAKTTYYRNPSAFQRGNTLPLSDRMVQVSIPNEMFLSRLKSPNSKSLTAQHVEPISIYVPRDETKRLQYLNQIAKTGKAVALYNEIRKSGAVSKETEDRKTLVYTFSPKTIDLLNIEKYLEINRKTHHALILDAGAMSSENADDLITQVKPFLSKSKLQKLKRGIANKSSVTIDAELLPDFPARVVRRHTAYRGPNCFHAALSFQGFSLAKSPNVNVKEEVGYHPSMINFDELWRVLKTSFYEINPERTDLKYGDMIVFFDIPQSAEGKPVNFRTIRHASTHLFDGYVFSKGSKSANTPYVVRTLSEEWSSWQAFAKNLGVKVFRRSSPKPNHIAVNDLNEWTN